MFRLFENSNHTSRELALRAAVDAVMGHRSREGSTEHFPEAIVVRYEVAGPGRAALLRWVERPDFARDLEERVVNRLARSGSDGLPALEFEVVESDADHCRAIEVARPVPTRLVLESSRFGWGRDYTLPASQRVFLVGRGPWRGDSPTSGNNDIVLPEFASFVSRRAVELERHGSRLRLTPGAGQRRYVLAYHADGGRIVADNHGRLGLSAGDLFRLFGASPELSITLRFEQGDSE